MVSFDLVTVGGQPKVLTDSLTQWRHSDVNHFLTSRKSDTTPNNHRLKHDKQCCRFYAYTQEAVSESNIENSRIRHVTILYFLEDGTMQLTEHKTDNSGLWQGALVRRHCIGKPGGGFLGKSSSHHVCPVMNAVLFQPGRGSAKSDRRAITTSPNPHHDRIPTHVQAWTT